MAHQDKFGLAKKAQKSAEKYRASGQKLSRSPADIQKEVKRKVSKELGLTTVPNTPPPGQKWSGMDSPTSTIAMNLTGKDKWFYGEEASAATDKYLDLYKSPVKKVDLKYGISGGAMGSGDPTGVMSSIPISDKMLQFQNKVQTVIGAGMSAIMPGALSIPGKLLTTRATTDVLQPGAAYEDYTKKFKAKQAGKKFTSTRNLFGLLGLQHKKKTLGQ